MHHLPRNSRRQRAILSCNDCRRRKLRCDRLDPCDRCIKGGIAGSCTYGAEAHSLETEDVHDRPKKKRRQAHDATKSVHAEQLDFESERDLHAQNDQMQSDTASTQRLEQLERDIALLQQRIPSHAPEPKDQVEFLANSPELKGIIRSSAVMETLKGRSYATHFYGASSAMSIVAHFPDLRTYMKAVYSDSKARRLSQDIKASEEQAQSTQLNHRVLSIPSLRSLLPDRPTVDAILKIYFDTFETTLRIIHVPTFQAAYQAYWQYESSGDVDMDAIILAILACTICTSTHTTPRYNHTGSSFHSKAALWVRACGAWLKRQSNKHRSLATLQVRCLRILALATANIKVKEYYQEVQAHVALMRSAGMHRDPSIFGTRCSVFEGEMRRRLWATTMEVEVQSCVDRGFPSSLSGLEYDCTPPRNINDVELHVDLTDLPRSHGVTTYTDTAYLSLAMQTVGLRIKMCSLINNLKGPAAVHDTFDDEDALRQHIANISRWSDPRAVQAMKLIELQMQQFVVLLHTPRALQVEHRRRSDCRYSTITALEAAATTINLHTDLLKNEDYVLLLTRNDYYRAMLLISHITYYAHKDEDETMKRFAKQISDECQEKSLRLQEERAMRPGRGSQFLWYVAAAIGLVGTQYSPQRSEFFKLQAVDRVAKSLYTVLSLYGQPTEETLATEVFLATTPSTTMHTSMPPQTSTEFPTAESFADAGLRLDTFDFGDTADYLVDDLWFLNIPPLDIHGQPPPGI